MKKVSVLIALASLVILACMVYLLRSGISLSPAVLIKPSHFSSQEMIAEAVVQRLFPQLTEYKNWELISALTSESELFVAQIRRAHSNVNVVAKSNLGNEQDVLDTTAEPRLYVQTYAAGSFDLSKDCETMKRLNYRCFVEISLHKSRRKMKDDGKKYFLMTSYLERHYLVLIQQ